MKPRILFAGSFQHYSAIILEALLNTPLVQMVGVITTPALAGAVNPVEALATQHHLPCFTPETLNAETLKEIETTLTEVPEFVLTAGYGKLLPAEWLSWPKVAALNLHFSLLPKYRGANPAEWALLMDEKETGVTLIEMSPSFDTGAMVAQATIAINSTDTRPEIYDKLYRLGGEILPAAITGYMEFRERGSVTPTVIQPGLTFMLPPHTQPTDSQPYAHRLTKNDSFIPWSVWQQAQKGETMTAVELPAAFQEVLNLLHQTPTPTFLERATRAVLEFPNLWTFIPTTKGEKRMKILSTRVEKNGDTEKLILERVQIEGQQPAQWSQVKNILKEE